MLNILEFCGQGDIRGWMNAPFKIANRVVATNGHIMAILQNKNCTEYAELTKPERTQKYILELIDKIESLDTWQTLDKEQIDFPEKETCKVCEGYGKAIKTECEECQGEGVVNASNDFSTYYDLKCASCEGMGFSRNLDTDKTCPDCRGSGKTFKEYATVKVLGVNVQCKYLSLVIDEPDLRFAVNDEKNMLMFRSGSRAHGAIMSVRG